METDEGIAEDSSVNKMFEDIIACKDVFYISQQKNDPELTNNEKVKILNEVLLKNKATFLLRYGKHLKQEHLSLFDPNEDYEIEYYLKEMQYYLDNQKTIVRNRRLTALKEMIEEGSYFSETEMLQREPTLYQNLVGKYLTAEEKRMRDIEECPGNSLVNILLQGIDKDNSDERQRLDKERDEMEEFESGDSEYEDEKMDNEDDEFDPSTVKQWGNFDKDESLQFPVATKNLNRNQEEATLIMAPEKSLLRDEFTGIMYANFLAGKDKDFDYSTVDDNARYDDETLRSRDLEDKYFDSEEPEEVDLKVREDKMSESSRSSVEDVLDTFMKHLNQELHRRDVDDMSYQLESMNKE